jgi:histidinol-phosphate aminotransferase
LKIEKLLRNNIKSFKAYSSARDEYTGKEGIFLDANENALGSVSKEKMNRYPDPYQREVKNRLAELKNVAPPNIFLGNGSDEAIDLLIRAFCEPRQEQIMTMPPTYGMYRVCADLNDVGVIEFPLSSDFEISLKAVERSISAKTKIIFICSPNNPSGNVMATDTVERLLKNFHGLVVIDEAYQDFSGEASWLKRLNDFNNLVVLQTFSKAWGMAGLRLGMAFANEKIIQVLNAIKYPYNVNALTQEQALQALKNIKLKKQMVDDILGQRAFLIEKLNVLECVKKVFPSDANFLLVRFSQAKIIYKQLLEKQIIVRDRSGLIHCEDCLRITVGTETENQKLIDALKEVEKNI